MSNVFLCVCCVTAANDLSLLFTHLDEDGDGEININELWKHSNVYKASAARLVFSLFVGSPGRQCVANAIKPTHNPCIIC